MKKSQTLAMLWLVGVALLCAALFGPLWPPSARAQQIGAIYCSQNAQYDASTNGSTRIFTANAASSARVYICGFVIKNGAVATNVQFKYGTGTNCGTGTANLTPNFVMAIADRIEDGASLFRGLVSPAGNDICLVTSAGNPVQAMLYYTYQQ